MSTMKMIGGLVDFIDSVRAAYSRRRTERVIGSLPVEIRKDIGWPDTRKRRNRSRVC